MKRLFLLKDKYLFLIVSFLFWFPHFTYIPFLSPYIEWLGGNYTFIGIVLGSYGLMQLLFRLPIGIFSDLLKVRKPFIIAGMLMSFMSCLIFSITDGLGWILLARILAGIAAATWVTFTVMYPSYFSDKEVHRAMAGISFVVVLAQFIGMSFSGYLVNEWGWRAPFWLGMILSLIGVVLAFLVLEPKTTLTRKPIKLRELVTVMREPSLLLIAFYSILAHSIIFTTMFGFTPTYALQKGLRAGDISLVVFAFMIPHATATLFMGKYAVPLFGKWRSLRVAFLLAAFSTFLMTMVQAKWFFLILQGINGFSLGLIFPLLLGMSIESIAQEKRATAMGAYQALYAIGIFAGPLIAGILNTTFGIESGFYFAGSLGMMATIIIAVQSGRKVPQPRQGEIKR